MRVVVSYDITDDKRRRKVMKVVEGYGLRVQYSVFECELDARGIAKLRSRLRPLVKKGEWESIRFYILCGECAGRVQVLGKDTARLPGALVMV